jgi:acetolactate synthase-1/2/3 large subunit
MDISRRRPNIDWIHTTVLQSDVVRQYVKWDRQPYGTADVIDSFARAYRVATQEPAGPVYLCYDAAFQEDPLEGEFALPDPEKTGPGSKIHPDPAELNRLADWLVSARQPVIVAGYMGRHKESFYRLIELAEAAGAAVIDQRNRLNFPTNHPLNVSGAARNILSQADVILALDVKDLYGALNRVDMSARTTEPATAPGCRVAEIGLRDVGISKWSDEFQQLMPVDMQVIADTSVALPELVRSVRSRVASEPGAQERIRQRSEEIGRLHAAARQRWREDAQKDRDASPITTARLAGEIWDAIRGKDWVLTANALSNWAPRLWDMESPERYVGSSLGTATQIGISLGVALAYKGSGKLVVDIQPDGDLMFDAGALWTAAQMHLPMLVVCTTTAPTTTIGRTRSTSRRREAAHPRTPRSARQSMTRRPILPVWRARWVGMLRVRLKSRTASLRHCSGRSGKWRRDGPRSSTQSRNSLSQGKVRED